MEETNSHSASQSTKSALVVSSAPLVVKGGQHEELVLPPLPLPVGRSREGEELVCGTVTTLLRNGRMNRQIIMVEAGPVESEGEMEQGQNG